METVTADKKLKPSFSERHRDIVEGIVGATAVLAILPAVWAASEISNISPDDVVHQIVTHVPGLKEQFELPGPADVDYVMSSSVVVVPAPGV